MGSKSSALIAMGCLLLASGTAWAEPFAGAQGYGAAATGGRGGAVVKVTTLDATGPGSLQEALDTEGARVVVFDVSGVIEADEIVIPHGDLTIAGQTAPGAGITIDGRLVAAYEFGVDNIVIQHVRVRLTSPSGPGEQMDALQLSRCATVMLDHVSVSFGIDETIDLYEASDITVQWSTIEQAATEGHPEGTHNYGLIQGPDGARGSYHHNLFCHNQNRNPALATGPSEVRNNVVYNVRHGFVHHNPADGHFSIVGNYYKAGGDDDLFPFYFDDEDGGASATLQYYLADNYIEDPGVFEGSVDDPWTEAVHPSFDNLGLDESYRTDTDRDFSGEDPGYVAVELDDALTAYDRVLACAGAWPRDVVTRTSIQDTIDGTGSWGANVPADLLDGLTPGTPEPDGDGDGMPDAWERANGLDPADGSDHATMQPSGNTAIELYLAQRSDAIMDPACASGPGGGDDGGDTGAETTGDTGGADATASASATGGSGATTNTGATTGSGSGTGDASDGGVTDTDSGCGCRSAHAPLPWLAALVLIAPRSRRRRASAG
jgi:pectate lyase